MLARFKGLLRCRRASLRYLAEDRVRTSKKPLDSPAGLVVAIARIIPQDSAAQCLRPPLCFCRHSSCAGRTPGSRRPPFLGQLSPSLDRISPRLLGCLSFFSSLSALFTDAN